MNLGRILNVGVGMLGGFALVAIMVVVPSALAQPDVTLGALPESSRSKVIQHDSLLQFRVKQMGNERLDLDQNVVRAAYQLKPDMSALSTPEATARAWLAAHGERFGISNMETLELARHVEAQGVHHLTFQQTHQGIPVYRRTVQVNLGLSGLPSMMLSAYAPHLQDGPAMGSVPVLAASEAKTAAAQAVSDGPVQTGDASLHVYPSETPRLIWMVMVWPEQSPGAWEVLTDANTGEIIHLIDRLLYCCSKG